jgi:peptide/nickel transport system ATP-binding protein
MQNEHLLTINNLSISFVSNNETKEVIHNISIKKNEILGIVGEPGSGKSVSSLAILGLLLKFVLKGAVH